MICFENIKRQIKQYKNIVDRLERIIEVYQQNKDQTIVDAMIRRFEFRVELSWKLLKDYLKHENPGDLSSPRSVVKKAHQQSLINDGQAWLGMIEDRKLSSHTYDEIVANTIRDNILNKYFKLLKELKKKEY